MKISISQLCVPTLISALLLFGFAAQAAAQSPNFSRLGRSPQSLGNTNDTPREDSTQTSSTYTEDVLYSFCPVSGCTDGKVPTAGLIRDTAGNLYGTTSGGGAHGSGTVFKIDTTGKYTVVYSFCSLGGSNCTDGSNPFGGLIEDSAGNLYGTTLNGGAYSVVGGTVFKIDSAGQETVLYSFCASNCLDGQAPESGLVRDAAGNLFGTTGGGGTHSDGTVFKVDTTGKETVLYNFCSVGGTSCTDGNFPFAGLIEDAAGNFYGTTERGGANNKGTVFKVGTTGTETVLYSFCSTGGFNCTDGSQPGAGLIEDAEGNLYGTTLFGGANFTINFGQDSGTVFKLDTTGHETVLYSFCSVGGSNCTDGSNPAAGLIADAAGNLYGTTESGRRRHSMAPYSSWTRHGQGDGAVQLLRRHELRRWLGPRRWRNPGRSGQPVRHHIRRGWHVQRHRVQARGEWQHSDGYADIQPESFVRESDDNVHRSGLRQRSDSDRVRHFRGRNHGSRHGHPRQGQGHSKTQIHGVRNLLHRGQLFGR